MKPITKAELILSALALIFSVFSGAGLTIMSYGRLTEKVDGLDQRLARIERLLDNRTMAEK